MINVTTTLAQLVNTDAMWVRLLPVLGILLIIFGLLLRLRIKRRRSAMQLTPREQIERLKNQQAMRGDLEHLMVEIEQLARRLGSQLDAKTIALENLINEADRKIQTLQRLNANGAPPSNPDKAPPAMDPAVIPRQTGEQVQQDRLAQAVYELADRGAEPVEIARQLNEGVGKVELILALRNA